jgi:hypothetical protein
VAPNDNEGQHIAQSAVELEEVASAVVFVLRPGSPGLELTAAAGVEGPALERLAAAVATRITRSRARLSMVWRPTTLRPRLRADRRCAVTGRWSTATASGMR